MILTKVIHIIMSLLLMVASTGVTLSMHYCGGELVSTAINKEAKTCCDGIDGCCNNKTLHYELEDDFISPVQLTKVKTTELDILFPILFALYSNCTDEKLKTFEAFNDSSPPPTINTRLAFLQTYLC